MSNVFPSFQYLEAHPSLFDEWPTNKTNHNHEPTIGTTYQKHLEPNKCLYMMKIYEPTIGTNIRCNLKTKN